ncbi:rhodanese-like domain-containing protein [Phaeodactylibacter luteus]|uniref:Rhodanese-like domain-containing protein n=1 Tax=Phaeodactylibacter luteus TaxID=1564516 RepID=A0A5C6RLK5_9BACT|nr:rhodanese-like domain-containing protein [Phaeodactylibacter luteus]TXB63248.1 rhodanese-like domain-containing protein [Phaeodactylibacter luteus]
MFGIINQLFGSGADTANIKAQLDNGAMLLDVRTPGEFNSGHAKGAVNIPLQSLQQNLEKIKKSGKPVVAYCRSGNRSGMAAQMLTQNGIEAYNAGSLGQVEAIMKG